jgi:hypothetical protein
LHGRTEDTRDWTEFTRPLYERSGGRDASDVGDAEWALVEPLMPAPKKVGRGFARSQVPLGAKTLVK